VVIARKSRHMSEFSLQWSNMRDYIRGSRRNSNSITLEPDRPQHDRPADCVIAQHYSSDTFVLLRFYSRKEKLGAFHQCYYFNSFIFKICISLKLRNLKLRKSRSVCILNMMHLGFLTDGCRTSRNISSQNASIFHKTYIKRKFTSNKNMFTYKHN
jgi:hypothetical protein